MERVTILEAMIVIIGIILIFIFPKNGMFLIGIGVICLAWLIVLVNGIISGW